MDSKENPAVLLKAFSERAVGFLLKSLKPLLEKRRSEVKERTETVGVDLGQFHLLVSALEKKGTERHEISHFRLEPRPSSPEATSTRLRAIFQEEGLDPKRVRVALKGQGIVIRILTFPQMNREEFASAIRFEIEKYIPFKSSEVILDFQILTENIPRGNAKFMEVLLVAVKQSEIYQCLRLFQNADLEIELIDLSAFAFANWVEFISPEAKEMPVAFLDMGAETSSFGVLLRGKPMFIRDITFGGSDLLKILKRRLGLEMDAVFAIQQNPSQVTPEYQEAVEQGLSIFLRELKLSLGYYLEQVSGAEPIQALFIGGGGSRFIQTSQLIERELGIPTRQSDILSRIGIHSRIDESALRRNQDLLPIVMGLCLR